MQDMTYISTTDLIDRLGTTLYARLSDRVNGTSPDAGVLAQIIQEAEAVADSYLGQRYATPVDLGAHPELAELLAARVLDLAEYGAWRGSPFVADPPQRVNDVQASALSWFESVASGRLVLPATTIPAATAADDGPEYTPGSQRLPADELDEL
jgi:phage gp36-like protein